MSSEPPFGLLLSGSRHDRSRPEAIRATAAAVGLGSLAWGWLLLGPLARAGIAPVAVVLAVAVAFGAPLAAWERRHQPLVRPVPVDGAFVSGRGFARRAAQVRRWLRPVGGGTAAHGAVALAESLGALAVAAVLVELARPFGALGLVAAALAWPAAGFVLARVPIAVVVPASAAVGLALLGALTSVPQAPWTLLEPTVGGWQSWAPGAVVAGLLLSTAGLGHWSTARSGPTRRRLAWLGTAIGGLALMGVALAASSSWQRVVADGPGGLGVIAPLAVGFGALAGVAAVVGRDADNKRVRALEGFAATVWWAWPAAAAVPGWWASLLPLGLAAVCLACVGLVRGWGSLWAVLGAALAVGAFVAGGSTLPDDAWQAAALAATAVGVVWRVGAQVVMEAE